ncbi:MAG: hypothetical protein JOY80_10115 [Candidatus Dormibacteraeota bacterium]|nr:hypothetical protein [Candidatus Dormibacteraeota bacterium]
MQQQYDATRTSFESSENSFDIAVSNAVSSGDYSQLPVFAETEWSQLQYFGAEVRRLSFPSAAKSDVAAMLKADDTLMTDVIFLIQGQVAADMAWVTAWRTDTAAARPYHVAVEHDIGLSGGGVKSAV